MPRPVHFEIHAEDTARARRFYEGIFGWQFQKWGSGPVEYWVVTTGPADRPGINGGLMKRMGAAPLEGQAVNAHVCTVGDVDDLDATVSKALSLGGMIALPRMPIPGVGWLVYIKDSEGNILGVMKNDPSAK